MNVDLSNTFKDARRLINAWKARYSPQEYPYKIVLNVFYRKFTIEKMWIRAMSQSHSTWQQAYQYNMNLYGDVASGEIVPVLEAWVKANKQVGMIKFSDFQPYIQSAAGGNAEAIKGIEYTYFLHRILDELIILWISKVNAGETKINAIASMTRAVLAEMPINDYATIEQVFDQLGAEQSLQALFIKEMSGTL